MIFDEIIKQMQNIIDNLRAADEFMADFVASREELEKEFEEEVELSEEPTVKRSLRDIIAGKLEK